MGNGLKNCLSIETTAQNLGVSLYSFEKNGAPHLLENILEPSGARQSELLVPTIEKILRRGHLTRDDLSLLSVDIGPGSFTGVRVGLAVARTLAQALEIPLVGISSLEAMAWSAGKTHPDEIIVPWLPATAGEVYFAVYSRGETLVAPCWKTEKDLQSILRKYKGAHTVTESPESMAIAEAGIKRFCTKPISPQFYFENVEPLYLQPSWAERSKRSA